MADENLQQQPLAPDAAQAKIAELNQNPEWREKFVAGDAAAVRQSEDLHRAAYPEQANASAPTPTIKPDEAKAKIKERFADPEWTKRFLSGDAAARQESEDLHKAAYPEASDDPEAGADMADLMPGPLPFEFAEDVPVEQQAEATLIAKQAVAAIGMDHATAVSCMGAINAAMVARNNRVMDDAELDTFNQILTDRFGSEYQAKCHRVGEVLRTAGRGAQWLRASLQAAGPEVAAGMFETLANLTPKQARR